jgi:hypothetical protein
MSDAGAADEWEVVVPEDDAELLAELKRCGVRPGQRLHVRSASSGKYRSAVTGKFVSKTVASKAGRVTGRTGARAEETPPAFFGSVRSGQRDLAERSEEILRAEFPGE